MIWKWTSGNPVPRVFEKLAAVADRVAPTAPEGEEM
jgi:hypothetical protein